MKSQASGKRLEDVHSCARCRNSAARRESVHHDPTPPPACQPGRNQLKRHRQYVFLAARSCFFCFVVKTPPRFGYIITCAMYLGGKKAQYAGRRQLTGATKCRRGSRNATGDGAAGNKKRDKEAPAVHRKDKSDSPFQQHIRESAGTLGLSYKLGAIPGSGAAAGSEVRQEKVFTTAATETRRRTERGGRRRLFFAGTPAPRSSLGSHSAEVPAVPGSVHGIPSRLRRGK